MSQLNVPVSRHPRHQPDPLRAKWRSLLATLVIAGLATIGATTLVAPAAAEEAAPADVAVVEPAPAEPAAKGPKKANPPGEVPPETPPMDSSVPESASEPGAANQVPSDEVPTTEPDQQALNAPPAAEAEVVAPSPSLTIVSAACTTYGGTGTLHYVLSDTHAVFQNFITVVDSEGGIAYQATHQGATEFDAEVNGLTVGGTYTIFFNQEFETGIARIDEQTFTVAACPDIGVSVTPLICSNERNGEALVTLTGLVSGAVAYDVQGPNFAVGALIDEVGATEEIELIGMPPGNYYAYVEWNPFFGEEPAPFPVFDWVGFAIEPCQPVITVEVTECSTVGGVGSALVTLSSLVAEVEYTVWVTDAGAPDGTPYGEPQSVVVDLALDGTGTAELTFTSLPGGRDLSVWVDGVWEAIPPWEEPPFIGNGGNFDPIETMALTAAADFSTQPCPVAVTSLAATGTDTAGLVLGGLTLLVLGSGALVVKRLRASRARG